MSYLSKALQQYYTREEKRITFKNNQSLNQLALAMWERLGYQQIDASVLSRVLHGERQFTTSQLRAFSEVLALSDSESEHLLHCLSRDINLKNNLETENLFITTSVGHDVIQSLVGSAFKNLYEGRTKELEIKCFLIESLIESSNYDQNASSNEKMDELFALNLYLKGRVVEGLGQPESVVRETLPIASDLLKLADKNNNKTIYAYANILLSNAYYLAGGYSYANNKYKFYRSSIIFGRKALDNLPDDNNEKLFGLRVMAASASYLKDYETIMFVFNKTKEILEMQPIDNRVNALHLCGTLSKGLAIFNNPNPFSLKESAEDYFKDDLANTGIYEVSSIKVEVDTLLGLKTGDKKYILDRIKRGIKVADENQLARHKSYFNKIMPTL